nr:reverse transcriptase domain-containing protein [Tanacetum cinerariifolium]
MDEIYTRLDDEQTERQLLAGRLNMLFRDMRAHAYTRQLMETEARLSREAWARATDASDLTHGEVISLRTTVLGQISEIRELQAADRRRQTLISELLRMDHRRSTETSESTNGDDSHNSGTGVRRTERADHECTYIDFLKCQPLPFKGTKGVASLLQWCERIESVFHISNCTAENQEADKIEKYVGGLPDTIHGSVVASKPKTMQEAIEIVTELMDKKVRTYAERETASKRKLENTS